MHCCWDYHFVQPPQKTVWRFLNKLKIELLYGLAVSLLGIYLKKTKTIIRKDICTPMFIVALITIIKIWKQSKYTLVDKWINKMFFS